MASDTSALMRRLRRIDGVELRPSRRHWLVYWQGRKVATLSSTPNGGQRSHANATSILRKAGIPL